MRILVRLALLLAFALIAVSTYVRLHESGIGCLDWPACYGRIGQPPAANTSGPVGDAYQRILSEPDALTSWATPLHGLAIGLLATAVLALNAIALRARQLRLVSASLLGLTVFLAWLWTRFGSLHDPALVMGVLAGEFTVLGLLGWLVFRLQPGAPRHTETRIAHMRGLTLGAIAVLGFQIVLGGLASVNFAATACQSLPDCQGGYLPDATIYSAFKLTGPHRVDASGTAIGGPERVAIHRAHRIGSILTLVLVLAAAGSALVNISAMRRAAVAVIALLIAEFAIGIAAIVTALPLALAMAHNLLAALLLLGLLRILAVSRERLAPRL